MPTPTPGIGYLIVNDILTDVAYVLIEPSVKTRFNVNTSPGVVVIAQFDPAIYVGALLVAGAGSDIEVVEVTAVTSLSFTATFANAHLSGEPIVGATFPVQQSSDPFFTQEEMLGYISQACSDFLDDCPLAIAVDASITVPPTAQVIGLPADCMEPVRVGAYGVPLRETSQSNLDSMDYRWTQRSASAPYAYFRDKVGLLNVGIFPRANNTTPLEIVYKQRMANTLGLADGFIFPDPFLIYVKYRVLEYAYSKDGEQRNPGLARYYNGRYMFGVKISKMFLEAVQDPNLEMAQ